MFTYNVYDIINKVHKKIDMQHKIKIPQQTIDETSFLLPKHDHCQLDRQKFDWIQSVYTDMLNQWKRFVNKLPTIQQRYVLGLMGFFAIVNAYTMRVSLSVAITEMVVPSINILTNETLSTDSCPMPRHDNPINNHTTNHIRKQNQYPWTSNQQGLILSSFYWGYIFTHLPGGILAERYGGKHVLTVGIGVTSLFTLATPLIIHLTNGDWLWLVFTRVCEGLGEGVTFPALNVLLASWIPITERSRIGSLVFAGSQIGTIIGDALSGVLISWNDGDWSNTFYVFGGCGFIWIILWSILCYATPETHPFISLDEREFLAKNIENLNKNGRGPIPWLAIFKSLPLWGLVAAQIGHDWGFFTMVTNLPQYMKDVLRLDVEENGAWSALPYVCMWLISLVAGLICDKLIVNKWLTVTVARKLFTTTASMGPAIFIMAAGYSGCNRPLVLTFLTIGMGFMGTFYCGMKVNALDLSPNYAGTLMAITNGIGGLTGIIVPYLATALTDHHTLSEWRLVFWISFGVFTITNCFYLLWGSGDVQSFNFIHQTNDDQNENGMKMDEKR